MGKLEYMKEHAHMIKWVREKYRKIPLEEVIKNKRVRNLKAWEEGIDAPTYAQLRGLAERYKIPVYMFWLKEPPFDPDAKKNGPTFVIADEIIESLEKEEYKKFKNYMLESMEYLKLSKDKKYASSYTSFLNKISKELKEGLKDTMDDEYLEKYVSIRILIRLNRLYKAYYNKQK